MPASRLFENLLVHRYFVNYAKRKGWRMAPMRIMKHHQPWLVMMVYGYIGTQVDKQVESLNALMNILYTMPETEDGFNEAKEAVIKQIEPADNQTKCAFNYLSAERRGLTYDVMKRCLRAGSKHDIR